MKQVPFTTIEAAKKYDPDAVAFIHHHFEGYIISRCLNTSNDGKGKEHTYVDEDLYYVAINGLFSAIKGFQFRELPDDYEP